LIIYFEKHTNSRKVKRKRKNNIENKKIYKNKIEKITSSHKINVNRITRYHPNNVISRTKNKIYMHLKIKPNKIKKNYKRISL
jgi:hypothetical protein